MTAARRWIVVALGLAVLVSAPVALRALPSASSDATAAELLTSLRASASVPYSGYAEADGGLQLPVTDRLSGLARLLDEHSRLRVWWRSGSDWRVDALELTGETDLIRSAGRLAVWQYEGQRATYTVDAAVRLPRSADLVPAVLARTAFAGAGADEVSRLPAERVAGRTAAGLRLDPADPRSTIDHVDAWVDTETGAALRVLVYGAGAASPVMSTSFLDFEPGRPDASVTAFTPPLDADVSFDEASDLAAAADRYAPVRPPRRLVGLVRRDSSAGGAVGTYGLGVTQLLAIPLRLDDADALLRQLETAPGVRVGAHRYSVSVGPLSLLLTPPRDGQLPWLLAGTVTMRTLSRASEQLSTRARVLW